MLFLGRRSDLALLEEIYSRPYFGLITFQGSRRISKNRLIHFFAKRSQRKIYEFQGLAPREGQSNKEQLEHFGQILARYLGIQSIRFSDWSEALGQMTMLAEKEKIIVLLDEIS